MTAGYLALEDGTVFRGRSVGAARRRLRRGGVHDGDDRLPGDGDRSELCRAARLLHRSDGGQLRRRRRAGRVRPAARQGRASCASSEETNGRSGSRGTGSVALEEIDTRALVLRLRDGGAMRAVGGRERRRALRRRDALAAVREQPLMEGQALVAQVSTPEPYVFAETGSPRVAVVDYGTKRSILRRLAAAGAAVKVVPHTAEADELRRFDGVVLSNGPGDPEPLRAGDGNGAGAPGHGSRARDLPRPSARSGSRPGTRRSSSPSATAAPITPCSTREAVGVLVTSQNHGFAVRPSRTRRPRTSRSTTGPSRASTSPS